MAPQARLGEGLRLSAAQGRLPGGGLTSRAGETVRSSVPGEVHRQTRLATRRDLGRGLSLDETIQITYSEEPGENVNDGTD